MTQLRRLGNTDLDITAIGLGTWAIGGPWQYGWGEQQDDESIQTIQHAIDQGINWIDTAPIYGLGHSEEVVGKAVAQISNKPYIFTKCSLTWDVERNLGCSLKADSVRQEVEASLKRLQVDTIDLMQIHWPNPDEDLEEGWQTLAELKEEGKIRWLGGSNFSPEQMNRVAAIAPISSNQPPYAAVTRGAEEAVLPHCLANNISTIVYSPMASGLLSGKMTRERIAQMDDDWRAGADHFKEPDLTKNLAVQTLMSEIATEQGVTTPAVAIAWTLHHPAVTGAIVGARRPDQIDGLIDALDYRMDDATYERITALTTASA